MIQKLMTIQLSSGLEARPVAVLVQKASQHDSTIYIEAEGKKVKKSTHCGLSKDEMEVPVIILKK